MLRSAKGRGLHPAIEDGDEVTSYLDLHDTAGGVAMLLTEHGISPGDRVAIHLRRGRRAAASFFGVLAAGAVAVSINESLRPRQIEYILANSGARAVLFEAGAHHRGDRRIVSSAAFLDVAEVAPADLSPCPRIEDDVAQIIYTSGSTGMPKGVTISHGNLWAGAEAVSTYLGLNPNERIASLLPFSFDYGLNQLLCSVYCGATLVVERSPVPQRIVQTLDRKQVTVLPAVPPLWLQLLGVAAFRDRPLTALRLMTNTGGRLPSSAVTQLRQSQPAAQLFLMYGLTEAFRSTYLPPHLADVKSNSIGRAIPGAEVLVVAEDGRLCNSGEIGELVHRGPTVALGYWNDPEATGQRFRPNPQRPEGTPPAERVVYSGDLVSRDDDGDLFFVGRRDRMIKTLGYRVSPDEVVDALHASGEIAEAIVVAEPDELIGSQIVAYVVLATGGDIDRLRTFIGAELPTYLQPRRIEVRVALERTSSGKHDPTATAEGRRDLD
jgi:amino acid adenylation domain-containing protein